MRPFVVEDVARPGLSLSVTVRGAHDVASAASGSLSIFRGALDDADLLRTPRAAGLEDLYVFQRAPADASIAFDVVLGPAVAGVRWVEDTFEALDAQGVPRLRAAAPWLVDAHEVRHAAHVDVTDCAVDRQPTPTWGREFTHLRDGVGGRACRLTLRWDAVDYPAVVDPDWTTTASMSTARDSGVVFVLDDKTFLVAGGSNAATTPVSTAELYNATANAWTATGSLSLGARSGAAGAVAGNVHAVVAGGVNAAGGEVNTAESYDATKGTWSAAGTILQATLNPVAVALKNGKILVTGGVDNNPPLTCYDTTSIYDPATNAWTAGPALGGCGQIVSPLADGRVLFAGGYYRTYSPPAPVTTTGVTTASIYDPTTNTATSAPSLSAARDSAAAVLVGSRVLVVGGTSRLPAPLGGALRDALWFDPASGWSSAGSLPGPQTGQAGATLSSGNVLFFGGSDGSTTPTSSPTSVFLAATPGFALLPALSPARQFFMSATLGGHVYILGGSGLASVLRLGGGAFGDSCVVSDECASGFCVEGVCCTTACNGACEACRETETKAPDGICASATKGTDPFNRCLDSGAASCQLDGVCDGAGKCESYAATTACAPSACTSGADCASGFCADGICCDSACAGPCQACTAARKGSGGDGVCGAVPANTNPRGLCVVDAGYPNSCKSDGMCDGAGSCRSFAVSGVGCGATSCSSVSSGASNGASSSTSTCDGGGTCAKVATTCGAFACSDATHCGTSCTADAQCIATAHCVGGVCIGKGANGASATDPSACASGLLADGVCCNTACTGICEACNVDTTTAGTCTAVTGKGAHGSCAGATSADPCSATVCDGTVRGSCAGFVGPTVPCRAGSCASSNATSAASCAGTGSCPAIESHSCGNYACAGTDCGAQCNADTDCSTGSRCDGTAHTCSNGATCDGAHTVVSPDGTQKDCSPMNCAGSTCIDSCATSADCVAGFVCDATRSCVASGAVATVAVVARRARAAEARAGGLPSRSSPASSPGSEHGVGLHSGPRSPAVRHCVAAIQIKRARALEKRRALFRRVVTGWSWLPSGPRPRWAASPSSRPPSRHAWSLPRSPSATIA